MPHIHRSDTPVHQVLLACRYRPIKSRRSGRSASNLRTAISATLILQSRGRRHRPRSATYRGRLRDFIHTFGSLTEENSIRNDRVYRDAESTEERKRKGSNSTERISDAMINKSGLFPCNGLTRFRGKRMPSGIRRGKNYLSIYGGTCTLGTYYRLALQSESNPADSFFFKCGSFPRQDPQ